MKTQEIVLWVAKLVATVIMLQTLYFKFTGAEESVYIFSKVGIEPWGRILTGVSELIASALILLPMTTIFGALMAIGIMSGAIVVHLFILGIEVKGDHGQLFTYALLVTFSSIIILFIKKNEIIALLKRFGINL